MEQGCQVSTQNQEGGQSHQKWEGVRGERASPRCRALPSHSHVGVLGVCGQQVVFLRDIYGLDL